MNKNAIVDFMFDELENNEAIKLKEDTNYIENLRTENEISESIDKYLKKRVHSKKTRKKIVGKHREKLWQSRYKSCTELLLARQQAIYCRLWLTNSFFTSSNTYAI